MSENNVVNLGERTGDNRMITVEQILEMALADIRAGTLKASSAMVIFQSDAEATFDVYASNMSTSQTIVALAVLQHRNVARFRGRE